MGGRVSGPLPFWAIGGVSVGRVEPCSSSRRLVTACCDVLTVSHVPKAVPLSRSRVRIISYQRCCQYWRNMHQPHIEHRGARPRPRARREESRRPLRENVQYARQD